MGWTSGRARRKANVAPFLFALIILISAAAGKPEPAVVLGMVILLGSVTVAGLCYVYRVRVVLTSDGVGRALSNTPLRPVSRAAVTSVLRGVLPPPPRGGSRPVTNFFLLDERGKPLLRLRDTQFRTGELDELVRMLGVPVKDATPEPLGPRQFASRYPGILPFRERRPALTAALFLGTLVLSILFVLSAVTATR